MSGRRRRSSSAACAKCSGKPQPASRWSPSNGSILTIAPREVVAIVGQTGCGKSTFFDLMIGLEAPTEGAIRIGDKSPHADFDLFRGRIATVFQQDRLLPWRSALDNAELPLELSGCRKTSSASAR